MTSEIIGERVKSFALLAAQLYAVVQTGLTLAGVAQLPWTSGQVSAAVTGVAAVALSVWSWWRNNNVTANAVAAQRVKRNLDDAETTASETGASTDIKGLTDGELDAVLNGWAKETEAEKS